MRKVFGLIRGFKDTLKGPALHLTDFPHISEFAKKFNYFEYHKRKLPVKLNLSIQIDPSINTSEYIELVYCLYSSRNRVDTIVPDLVKRFKAEERLTSEAFSNLLSLTKSKVLSVDEKLEKMIFGTLVEKMNFMKINDLILVSDLLFNKTLSSGNEAVYIALEKIFDEYFEKMSLVQILAVLRGFNPILHKFPSDIHVKAEQKVIKEVKNATIEVVGYVLSTYAAAPRVHHFSQLSRAIADRILESPAEFLDTSKAIHGYVLHYFSKLRGFEDVLALIPKYIPTITEELADDPTRLGMFFLTIIRKPPSAEYKKKILQQLFKYADKLDQFRKKKIVIAMVNDENPEFWDNVHKLKVFWGKDEALFVSKELEVLSKHGLIREL